jgi:hypothetical protein
MLIRLLLVGALAAGALASALDAQTSTQPPGRGHHVLFYDEASKRVMLAGGGANDAQRRVTIFTDLWSFDGSHWSQTSSASEALVGARVAIGPKGRIHAFGGFAGTITGNLVALENSRWTPVGVHPSITSSEGGFVFDRARNRFVAFGGSGSRGMNSDVWEFDGTRWTRNPAVGPPARAMHAMVFDPIRNRTVVFGGLGVRTGAQSAPLFADTWEFDGTSWRQLLVNGPSPRLGAGVTYDAKRGVVLLFGGGDHDRVFNDLWSWDGKSWRKLADAGPEARIMGYLAYDANRDRTVLFGGRRRGAEPTDLNDTWEWNGDKWRRVIQ